MPLLIILGAYMWFVRGFLFRPLWFDEALTVLNFALAPNPAAIYLNYSIPNNQICYTFLLRLWIEFQPAFLDTTVWLRLLSVLLGAGTLFRTLFACSAPGSATAGSCCPCWSRSEYPYPS